MYSQKDVGKDIHVVGMADGDCIAGKITRITGGGETMDVTIFPPTGPANQSSMRIAMDMQFSSWHWRDECEK